ADRGGGGRAGQAAGGVGLERGQVAHAPRAPLAAPCAAAAPQAAHRAGERAPCQARHAALAETTGNSREILQIHLRRRMGPSMDVIILSVVSVFVIALANAVFMRD